MFNVVYKTGRAIFGSLLQVMEFIVYNGKSFTNFTTRDGLNSNSIFSILEDKKGNIWFGTDKGVCIYNGNNFSSISSASANELSPGSVTSILEDKNGKFWFVHTMVFTVTMGKPLHVF
jgi:ligand-binding sensor domain-containing protein